MAPIITCAIRRSSSPVASSRVKSTSRTAPGSRFAQYLMKTHILYLTLTWTSIEHAPINHTAAHSHTLKTQKIPLENEVLYCRFPPFKYDFEKKQKQLMMDNNYTKHILQSDECFIRQSKHFFFLIVTKTYHPPTPKKTNKKPTNKQQQTKQTNNNNNNTKKKKKKKPTKQQQTTTTNKQTNKNKK